MKNETQNERILKLFVVLLFIVSCVLVITNYSQSNTMDMYSGNIIAKDDKISELTSEVQNNILAKRNFDRCEDNNINLQKKYDEAIDRWNKQVSEQRENYDAEIDRIYKTWGYKMCCDEGWNYYTVSMNIVYCRNIAHSNTNRC